MTRDAVVHFSCASSVRLRHVGSSLARGATQDPSATRSPTRVVLTELSFFEQLDCAGFNIGCLHGPGRIGGRRLCGARHHPDRVGLRMRFRLQLWALSVVKMCYGMWHECGYATWSKTGYEINGNKMFSPQQCGTFFLPKHETCSIFEVFVCLPKTIADQ